MIERTDEVLAQTFRERGDREALSALIERHESPIYTYLLRILKDPHDAEEAAQDCFVRMLRGLPGYRSELPFRPWLYRIALNCARTLAVRKAEQKIRERAASASGPEGAKGMTPAEAAARNEILRLVDDLPETQKEAVTLHYCQGLSHSEVASVLDVPAGTVATRIHTGLQSLRTRLASVGIVLAGVTLEEALQSADAATAPVSILKTVLREAAQAAPSGAAAASAVHGGLIVAKTKMSAMVAVAIACTVGGGIAGYGIRGTRAERELAAMETPSRPRPVAALPVPEKAAVPAAPAASAAPSLAPTGAAVVPVAAPTPAEARSSKLRKLAAFLAMAIRKESAKMGPKESAEMMTLLTDPELQGALANAAGGPGSPHQLGGELYMNLLEEFNVHLSDAQKGQVNQLIKDLEPRKLLDEPAATAVDRRIVEMAVAQESADKLRAIFTPEQREHAKPLLRLHNTLGGEVPVTIESEDRMVPALLNAWSEKLVLLDEGEKARVTQAAELHAGRLSALQAELGARYGADFVDRLRGCLGYAAEWAGQTDPAFDTMALDAVHRLLELERQNRQTLMAALPERAEDIRKAQPNVYLLTIKKK